MQRALDIVVSAVALVVLAPVIALVALLVAVRLGRPVMFNSVRVGRDGRHFRVLKFRSMTNERGPDGRLLPDADRLTSFGRRLRSTSLDELPQLWNVLRGDMALVGPRPLPALYVALYSPWQMRRLEVRPGLTGWSQVNGRNSTTWEQRFDMDVWYVDHRSLALDLRILARTVVVVLTASGVSADGHATMESFRGSPRSVDVETESA